MAGSIYAVLVAVERYQKDNIAGVSFAVADAEAMRDMLIRQLHVPPDNIQLWKNEHATRATFEEDLRYQITTLGPEDQFIFFYAGHGFYADGSNRLSTWETRSFNVGATTVCVNNVLLSPLKGSHCRKSLVFIDACASTYVVPGTRSVLEDMKPEEFEDFVKSTEYCAAYFSCSPAQQSYSSEKLKHGIWTYHLLRAFNGEEERAFEDKRRITGQSLQNYLTLSVPEFIAKKTEIKAPQRPYAILSAHGTFEILTLPERANESTEPAVRPLGPAADKPMPVPAAPAPISVTLDTARILVDDQRYLEQRKRLAETEVMSKIWGLPRWKLWSRPLEFRKARFRNLEHCTQFVASANVRSNARWSQYPWLNVPPAQGIESVAAEIDLVEVGVEHTERWVLFQSGQFVHNMALDRVPPLGGRTHVLEILEVITGLYEFTARMAEQHIMTDDIGVTIALQGVAGRQLAWHEGHDLSGWSQEDIAIESIHTAAELQARRRELALDAAINIYAHFGWKNPPRSELEALQHQRFGPGPALPKARPTANAVGKALITVHESLPVFDTSHTSLSFSWGEQISISVDWLQQDDAKGMTCVFVNERGESIDAYSLEVTEAMFWSAKHAKFLENECKPRFIHRGQKLGPDSRTHTEWLIRRVLDTGSPQRLAVGNGSDGRLIKPNNNTSNEEVWRLTLVPIFKPLRDKQVRLSNAHLYVRYDREHDTMHMAKDPVA